MERLIGCLRTIVLSFMAFLISISGDSMAREGQWICLGPRGSSVSTPAIDPHDTNTLYAGTMDGVFRMPAGVPTDLPQ